MEFISKSYTYLFGEIDYCYFEKEEMYPDGLLVFMGSYIYMPYRGQGHYKEMVRTLLNMFPEGTVFQAPVENKILVPMFKRMGEQIVEKIEYWGNPQNCKVMQGIINKEIINNI